MHSSAKPFSLIDQPVRHSFFQTTAPNWKMPSPAKFPTDCLNKVCNVTMSEAFHQIKNKMSETLGFDSATDNLAKCNSNVILHTYFPILIEYLQGERSRKMWFVKWRTQLKDLDKNTGIICIRRLVLNSCNGMREDQICSRKNNCLLGIWMRDTCFAQFYGGHGETIVQRYHQKMVYIARTIKTKGMVRNVFEVVCKEKHKVFIIPLYTKQGGHQ